MNILLWDHAIFRYTYESFTDSKVLINLSFGLKTLEMNPSGSLSCLPWFISRAWDLLTFKKEKKKFLLFWRKFDFFRHHVDDSDVTRGTSGCPEAFLWAASTPFPRTTTRCHANRKPASIRWFTTGSSRRRSDADDEWRTTPRGTTWRKTSTGSNGQPSA